MGYHDNAILRCSWYGIMRRNFECFSRTTISDILAGLSGLFAFLSKTTISPDHHNDIHFLMCCLCKLKL